MDPCIDPECAEFVKGSVFKEWGPANLTQTFDRANCSQGATPAERNVCGAGRDTKR
jgi:hypothetical protein